MGHVPARLHGVWQRSLYAEPADGEPAYVDRDTQVFWLQAGDWHADLRVRADRSDFSGIASIEHCSRAQRIELAGQTAFAGITCVEGAFCTWHRLVDLGPGMDKDIGAMRFIDDDNLEERHPRGLYRELWQRLPVAANVQPIVRFYDNGLPRWLEYGDYAMAITPRTTIGADHDPLADPATLDEAALCERLSLCIEFARREPSTGGWRVVLTTHPWREGQRTET